MSKSPGVRADVTWFAIGAIAALPVLPFVVLLFIAAIWFPPLTVLLLVGFVYLTRRARRRRGVRVVRIWTVVLWATLTSAYYALLVIVANPPGAGLPEREVLIGQTVTILVFLVVGSGFIALGANRLARRIAAASSAGDSVPQPLTPGEAHP